MSNSLGVLIPTYNHNEIRPTNLLFTEHFSFTADLGGLLTLEKFILDFSNLLEGNR